MRVRHSAVGGTAFVLVVGALAGTFSGCSEVSPLDGGGATGGVLTTGGAATGGVGTTGGSGGAIVGPGGSGSGGEPPVCAATYDNPLIWEDLPDLEIIRVDETYYYTSSTFHYSPGAPVLRSTDLVHWETIGHSVPVLDFHPSYDLNGDNAYVNGIWASTLQYRPSNQTFYWMGCMHGVGGAYVYTAQDPAGPWEKHASQNCYYDMGLLVDDDDKLYVAYGNNELRVAELTADGFGEVRSQKIFDSPSNIGPLEGSRFVKFDGNYYVFVTQYANGEYVLRSTNGPFGPYELRPFAVKLPYAGVGAGWAPHQGGVVETQNGDWYYAAFNDSYPAGRLPVLAPMTWKDGWPEVELVDGEWGASYPFPDLPCGSNVRTHLGVDRFTDATLAPEWEWNHNPDDSKWSTGSGLVLETATLTNDVYAARNTLTHRMPGPVSSATIELDFSEMKNGDVAGLAAWRDSSAFVGVKRTASGTRVVVVDDLTLDSSWNTSGFGNEVADADVAGSKIWLRVEADVRTTGDGGVARFAYSTNGIDFTALGTDFVMKRDWPFFTGYRYAIFHYATESLGGRATIASFDLRKE